ncbi:hypothetical protein B0H13DRAFT_2417616, partial [Mycena leptocephala]
SLFPSLSQFFSKSVVYNVPLPCNPFHSLRCSADGELPRSPCGAPNDRGRLCNTLSGTVRLTIGRQQWRARRDLHQHHRQQLRRMLLLPSQDRRPDAGGCTAGCGRVHRGLQGGRPSRERHYYRRQRWQRGCYGRLLPSGFWGRTRCAGHIQSSSQDGRCHADISWCPRCCFRRCVPGFWNGHL